MSETANPPLWLRMWKLTVGSKSGEQAINLSDLAFEFSVEVPMLAAARATITIFNVEQKTLDALQKQYTVVRLEAGYTPPSRQYGLLFQGEIAYFRYGRRDALDSFVEIVALTGDKVFTLANVNTTLPAGSTKRDELNAVMDALKPYGITLGQVGDLGDARAPRGRTLFAAAPAALRDIAQSTGSDWVIDDMNRLHLVKRGETLSADNIPVLNTASGMIDVPTVTLNGGVDVKCLLNPSIRPLSRIQISQKELITQYAIGNDNSATGATALLGVDRSGMMQMVAREAIHGDGVYAVWSVTHTGQNRGNPWHSHITTTPLKAPSGGA
jgi:hypothetical protein